MKVITILHKHLTEGDHEVLEKWFAQPFERGADITVKLPSEDAMALIDLLTILNYKGVITCRK